MSKPSSSDKNAPIRIPIPGRDDVASLAPVVFDDRVEPMVEKTASSEPVSRATVSDPFTMKTMDERPRSESRTRPLHVVLVGTMTGGQGKSLISELAAILFRSAKIVAIDTPASTEPVVPSGKKSSLPDSGDNVSSRLLRNLPDHRKAFVPFIPDPKAAVDDRYRGSLLFSSFEAIGDQIRAEMVRPFESQDPPEVDMIIDFGANMIEPFLVWLGSVSSMLPNVRFTLVVPVTAVRDSVEHASRMLTTLKGVTSIPLSVVVIENEVQGNFTAGYLETLAQVYQSTCEDGIIRPGRLSRCPVPAFGKVEIAGGLWSFIQLKADDLLTSPVFTGTSPFESTTQHKAITAWVKDSLKILIGSVRGAVPVHKTLTSEDDDPFDLDAIMR